MDNVGQRETQISGDESLFYGEITENTQTTLEMVRRVIFVFGMFRRLTTKCKFTADI